MKLQSIFLDFAQKRCSLLSDILYNNNCFEKFPICKITRLPCRAVKLLVR